MFRSYTTKPKHVFVLMERGLKMFWTLFSKQKRCLLKECKNLYTTKYIKPGIIAERKIFEISY